MSTQAVVRIENEQYLNTRKAAKYMDVADNTLREWKRKGMVRAYRAGRVLRFKKSDLDAFLSK